MAATCKIVSKGEKKISIGFHFNEIKAECEGKSYLVSSLFYINGIENTSSFVLGKTLCQQFNYNAFQAGSGPIIENLNDYSTFAVLNFQDKEIYLFEILRKEQLIKQNLGLLSSIICIPTA